MFVRGEDGFEGLGQLIQVPEADVDLVLQAVAALVVAVVRCIGRVILVNKPKRAVVNSYRA